ncbi:hypothetical protein PX699_26485 [Sphingobium sp. H39-3-25]|nr:hypothetical protein [Sphingobium arseniciresistens]
MPNSGIQDMAGTAVAEEGIVLLDGPSGVAVSMTADAAEWTGKALIRAAEEARDQIAGPD